MGGCWGSIPAGRRSMSRLLLRTPPAASQSCAGVARCSHRRSSLVSSRVVCSVGERSGPVEWRLLGLSASWSPVGASGMCVVVVVFLPWLLGESPSWPNGGRSTIGEASGACVALLLVVACGIWHCWVVVVHRYFAHRWVAAGGVAQLAVVVEGAAGRSCTGVGKW